MRECPLAIDTQGKLSIDWNSQRMSWAYAILDDKTDTKFTVHFGCNRGEDFQEEITIAP